MNAAALMVFRGGTLMRKVSSLGTATGEYTWTAGSKTVVFVAALSSWISVYYVGQLS